MILRCPICMGDVTDVAIEMYEDDYKRKTTVTGRCSKCGAPIRIVKEFRKDVDVHKYIPWRCRTVPGVAP